MIFFSNQRGSALISVVLGVSLIFAGSAFLFDSFTRRSQQFGRVKDLSREETMELAMRRNVRSPVVIMSSVLGIRRFDNLRLYNCLFNEGPDMPNDCNSAATFPVALYDDENLPVTGPSPANAVCYTIQGQRAAVGDPCVFSFWTEMTPRCDVGTLTCNVARGFDIIVHMTTTPTSGASPRTTTFTSYAPLSEAGAYGQWSVVITDFKDPGYKTITWYGGPLADSCVDVDNSDPLCTPTANPAGGLATSPGVGVGGGGGGVGAPSPTACAAGFVRRGGSCQAFSL